MYFTGSGGGGTPPASAAGGSVAAAGPGSAPTAPASGAQPDYSAQWAEYYRSIGKLKEAEAIEAQIKLKVTYFKLFADSTMSSLSQSYYLRMFLCIQSSGGGSSAGSAGSSGGGGASGGAGAAGQYAQYGVYAPQVYPAAYQPYPYAAQPAPDHHQ